jgi:hypothetical protein
MFLSTTDRAATTAQRTSLFNLAAMYRAAAQEVIFAAVNPAATKEPGPLAGNRNFLFVQANGPGHLYRPLWQTLNLMVRASAC